MAARERERHLIRLVSVGQPFVVIGRPRTLLVAAGLVLLPSVCACRAAGSSAPSVISAVPIERIEPSSAPSSSAVDVDPDEPVTLDSVVAAIEADMRSHPEEILSITWTSTIDMMPNVEVESQYFVDVFGSRVRQMVNGGTATGTDIWVDEERIIIRLPGGNTRTLPSIPCAGMSIVISLILDCEAAERGGTPALEFDNGRPVIVITATVPQTTQTNPTCGGATCPTVVFSKSFTRRIELDPTTFLPTAIDEAGSMDLAGGFDYTGHTDITTSYVDPDRLGADLFVPPAT